MPARKAPKRARQEGPESGGDRIGALPDEILRHVLSFLPAQQAVQTCVLARRWRHLWKSATGLRIVGADGEAPVPFKKKAREFVDSLLLLRGSSPLETFELRVAGSAVDVRRVRLWVRYAVEFKVQVLRLSFLGNTYARMRPEDPPLTSKYLTKLELCGVAFNGDFLDLSRCPALQDLEIEGCSFVVAGRISSQSLKRLRITRPVFNRSSRARIHAPNLTTLHLQVSYGKTPVLEGMPLLISALVAILGKSDCCSRSNYGDCGDESCENCMPNDTSPVLLHGLSQAKNLVLGAKDDTYIFRRDLKCCPTFTRLKSLLLNETCCVPDIQVLARILEHSPVLEELYLILIYKMQMQELNVIMKGRFSPKELPPIISAHLKSVVVRCGAVDERVIQVLKFLSELNISFSFTEEKLKAEG
ncbi:MEIOTIC F-BOX protein MOF-like [Miscanthus floridulus]|uniref:MEIOTIC F-BOX protein MOF-like n=1 Tax=Miscanthus floridulus TaxID=154761 RepID=UPI0034595F95